MTVNVSKAVATAVVGHEGVIVPKALAYAVLNYDGAVVSKAVAYAVLNPSPGTILWCGGEETDLVTRVEPNYTDAGTTTGTTAGRFRADYARGCIEHTQSSVSVELGRGEVFAGGGVTSFWVSFYVYSDLTSGTAAHPFRVIKSGVTTSSIDIGTDFSETNINLYGSNGSSIRGLTGTGVADASFHRVDARIDNFGSVGFAQVYVDGESRISASFDMSDSGASDLDQFALFTAPSGLWSLSEIIIATGDTRTMSLLTLAPEGPGFKDEWTGDETAFDEAVENDSDSASSSTAGQEIAVKLTDLP